MTLRGKLRAILPAVLALGIVGLGGSVALTQTVGQERPVDTHTLPPERPVDDVRPCEWPCPGHRYEVVYDLRDGSIEGLADYDPSDPEEGRMLPAEGQAVLDIAWSPALLDLRKDMGSWVVDLSTLSLKQVREPITSTPGVGAPGTPGN